MKINDKETLSIAAAVSDVLEGKTRKEEAKYPHDMFHPKTGEKEVAKTEKDHEELSKKGYTHDKPEVDEVAEPVAKGEKEFKAKHTVKKSGMKDDGTNMKEAYHADDEDEKEDEKEGNEFTMALAQARKNGDKDFVVSGKKYMVKDQKDDDDKEEVEEAKSKFPKALVKKATELALKMGGNMTGAYKKIEKMKKGLSDDPEVKAALQLANEEVSEEVVEEAIKMNEAEDKKAKYKAFFDKALKKFGVDSPAELKGDKKKEFFDYVDANYNSEDEPGKDGVNEVLGFVKKAVDKIKGKSGMSDKAKDNADKMKNDGSNDPAQVLKDKIDELQAKMKSYEKKEKDAESDEKADYWLELFNKAAEKVTDLKKKLKEVE